MLSKRIRYFDVAAIVLAICFLALAVGFASAESNHFHAHRFAVEMN